MLAHLPVRMKYNSRAQNHGIEMFNTQVQNYEKKTKRAVETAEVFFT